MLCKKPDYLCLCWINRWKKVLLRATFRWEVSHRKWTYYLQSFRSRKNRKSYTVRPNCDAYVIGHLLTDTDHCKLGTACRKLMLWPKNETRQQRQDHGHQDSSVESNRFNAGSDRNVSEMCHDLWCMVQQKGEQHNIKRVFITLCLISLC